MYNEEYQSRCSLIRVVKVSEREAMLLVLWAVLPYAFRSDFRTFVLSDQGERCG